MLRGNGVTMCYILLRTVHVFDLRRDFVWEGVFLFAVASVSRRSCGQRKVPYKRFSFGHLLLFAVNVLVVCDHRSCTSTVQDTY